MRIRISPKSNTDINGIISYFFFHKSRINDYVDVFASSTYTFSNFSGPFVTINPLLKGENGNSDNWCSLNYNRSFIQLSFKKHYVYLTNYALTSRTNWQWDMPKSWEVHGSVDNETWVLIDTKKDTTELSQLNQTRCYKSDANGIFKHIKVVQTINADNKQHLCLNKIDLFGTIYMNQKTYDSNCHRRNMFSFTMFIIVLLVIS